MRKYLLDENNAPVICEDLIEWGLWLEKNRERRRVGDDDVGDYHISTIFLGLDHNYDNKGLPILFETMVFLSSLKVVNTRGPTLPARGALPGMKP